MIVRLNTAEVAAATRRHVNTVLLALEAGDLHGTQSTKGGRWLIREDCAEAWADKSACAHQKQNVISINQRRSAS